MHAMHIPCICHACVHVHVSYIYRAYAMHAMRMPCIYRAYTMHIPRLGVSSPSGGVGGRRPKGCVGLLVRVRAKVVEGEGVGEE